MNAGRNPAVIHEVVTGYDVNSIVVTGTVQPAPTQTTSSLPGWFHFSTMGLLAATIVLLASSGFLVRRWWVRRQNPGLFDEDEE